MTRALLVRLSAAAAAVVVARPAHGQADAVRPGALDGAWRGTSLCTIAGRPTCHDETVVYHLRTLPSTPAAEHVPPGGGDVRVEWVMNKIVSGREEEMGTLICVVEGLTVNCPMRDWNWGFHVNGDAISGTLVNAAGVTWRNVEVRRVARADARQPARKP